MDTQIGACDGGFSCRPWRPAPRVAKYIWDAGESAPCSQSDFHAKRVSERGVKLCDSLYSVTCGRYHNSIVAAA